MASAWHQQACPICGQGTLHDQSRKQQLNYRGKAYEYPVAFCDHCGDGFPEPDPVEETAWLAFRFPLV
jgi:YgiT-type zinc finger domain-containing protein